MSLPLRRLVVPALKAPRHLPSRLTKCMATVSPNTVPSVPDGFRLGTYPVVGGEQEKPVHKVRFPKFESLEAEREHRKLHHAAALRWLGYNGYNNEGAGGHVTVRDPILPDHFWVRNCLLHPLVRNKSAVSS